MIDFAKLLLDNFTSLSSFDDVCNQADARMYDDKKHHKHREITRT